MSSHGHGKGRAKKHEEEEHVNHERWLVSYSDFMTVLMALFIVMYAMSQVDSVKYVALRNSLSAGFQNGSPVQSVLDGSDGVMDGLTPSDSDANSQSTAGMVNADDGLGAQASDTSSLDQQDLAAAQQEATHLESIEDQMNAALQAAGLQDSVQYRISARGLIVGLVANDVFFSPSSAELTDKAAQVIDQLAPSIVGLTEQISVEGHANVLPPSSRYPTNWELSQDRAVKVLRRLVEHDGMAGTRISATGFGDTQPLVEGTDDAAMAANRRVDIVILSGAPDNVRALLPTVVGQ